MKTLVTLLASVLLFLGCATNVDTLNVSLVNVQFTEATVFESTAIFTVRLNNEAPAALQLDGGVHKIYLNGLYVGEGLSNESLELPRLGSTTQQLKVHLSNLALATRIKPIIESRVFDYRIRSTLYTQPSGRVRAVSEGRLDVRDFQPTPKTL